jgi:transcription elongation factor SPT5
VAYAKRGRPLGITSVVVAQTKGKIYVESYNEPSVIEAVQGVRGLMTYSMRKVPISDMTTVMTVIPKKVPGECRKYDYTSCEVCFRRICD